jgi:hypothetical protein
MLTPEEKAKYAARLKLTRLGTRAEDKKCAVCRQAGHPDFRPDIRLI